MKFNQSQLGYPFEFLWSALSRLFNSSVNFFQNFFLLAFLQIADFYLALFNFFLPSIHPKHNVPMPFSPQNPPHLFYNPFLYSICLLARFLGPERSPQWLKAWSVWNGVQRDGTWRDVNVHEAKHGSRSPCPGLNALANHVGIINASGRDLSFHQLAAALSRTYNISPTFSVRALLGATTLWEGRETINLSDLCAHGLIEHDGSLLRPDVETGDHKKANQSHPYPELVDKFFPPGNTPVKPRDLSRALTIRRMECAAKNPAYYRSFKFDLIGSENCAILLAVTGGNRDVIRRFAGIDGIERFDPYWRPASRQAFGLTMVNAQFLLGWIELGTGSSMKPRIRQI
ncbi:hypothetical protein DFH28DRAFT_882641 [Melampsora americana]|nr:hypothetical protein DFH28DRAFT_882641 [Melampsora americana]